jgi:muramoyltetrapeptide carboxypeptidase
MGVSRARTKPAALKPGDTIGIVAPASSIQREMLEAGCNSLRDLGYKPFYFDSILERDLYFAGSLERRKRELEEMFSREDVRAILCARGGYGTNYLLQSLEIEKIAANPKIFVGYSDVTTLLTWFADEAGFVTFHGPMVTKDFSQQGVVDLSSWSAALNGAEHWEIRQDNVGALAEGSAAGMLYGGCLSMLAASLGTPYEVRTEGTILFIEDIAAKPYQIDRMLMQLKLAGKFEGVRGIVFGEMLDCIQSKDQEYRLQEVIMRVVGDLGIPIAYGLPSGHVSSQNVTLPIGVQSELQVGKEVTLKILEAATSAVPAASVHAGKR